MALKLLRVLVLGVIAAAADDVNVTWSGARAALPCAVAGRERLRVRRPPPPLDDDRPRGKLYLWRHDDLEVSPKRVSSNGTLDVSRKRDGEGRYQCGVRHQGGLVLGYAVTLKFASMDKEFVTSPDNVTAVAGQPFVMSCVIRSAPPAAVSWVKDDRDLPQNDRYHVLANQLLIMDVQNSDAGLYKCTATNAVLGKSRTSPEGRLLVRDGVSALAAALLPTELAGNFTEPRGSRVVLPCPVLGWPRPKLIWELTPPGGRTSELEHTEEVLVLTSLELDQEGVYTCAVEGNGHLFKKFNVTVTEPPVITIPPVSKEALRASTIRFNCTAAGRPAPSITWYKDGQALVLAGRINMRISTDGKRDELVISGVTSDDAGVYQCFAQNVAGVSSAWTTLNVTGADAGAPDGVQCWPEGERTVRVRWSPPPAQHVVAYTVHSMPQDAKPGTTSFPRLPHPNTEELVSVEQALTPYRFQVRAYVQLTNSKNVASDMSESVVCQGQGVPIRLTMMGEDSVSISWKQFADATPAVVEWILQYKAGDSGAERNVSLDGATHQYTLHATPSEPLLVRVLGSKTPTWLQQDLSQVPWTTTAGAGKNHGEGNVMPVPYDLEATDVSARGLSVSWRCEEADELGRRYVFLACATKADRTDVCKESNENSAMFEGLQPKTEYTVRVQSRIEGRALGGALSAPYVVTTLEDPLTGQFINFSTLRVSWKGPPAKYTVHYTKVLKLPLDDWHSVETNDTTVLITDIDPTVETHIMVTEEGKSEKQNPVLKIPPLFKDMDPKELQYEYISAGLRVWWNGVGPRVVAYTQNLSLSMEQWATVKVNQPSVELTGLDPGLPTHVMVTVLGSARPSHALTIKPRPATHNSVYYGVGIGVGVCILCLLAVAAVCVWRRRKRARSPVRSRRRNVPAAEGTEEEGSEMKNIGGRLANGGGSKDAGEPLLNGHVHITENPTSKTPNGKMKRGRLYEAAFDVSRYEDPDCTLETTLDADTSPPYSLLDASRRPEYDPSRSSHDVGTNDSFNKLPDDNMNSELTRSTFQLDNSKIQPTLQPNG